MRDDARIMGNSPIRTMNRFSCETPISEALGETTLFSRVLVIIVGGERSSSRKTTARPGFAGKGVTGWEVNQALQRDMGHCLNS